MTTVFENRHDDPDAFLRELGRDISAGSVTDKIVRLAYRRAPATYRLLDPGHAMSRDNEKLAFWFAARFVEASFIARGQLTKLSGYCGLQVDLDVYRKQMAKQNPLTTVDRSVEAWQAKNAETWAGMQSLAYRVQAACEGMDLREGATFVEEGAWIADPMSPLEVVPAPRCATCGEPIYIAAGRWRHDLDMSVDAAYETRHGREEAFTSSPCPACGGLGQVEGRRHMSRCLRCTGLKVIQKLHHLAHPTEEGKQV